MTYKELIQYITDTENDDENVSRLQNAMNYFCSTWDECEGYKYALIKCLQDQYENHPDEQDPDDLKRLQDIIDGAI